MNNKERHLARYIRRRQHREQQRIKNNNKYDNYNILLDPVNLYNAFYQCKKGVSWKWSVQYFHMHLLENINEILKSLNENKILSKGFVYFTINERGKQRNIQSLHITERVQQKVLCNNILLPIFKRKLIYDNGASLKNKGVSFARKRLIKHLNEYYKKYKNTGYVLITDFRKYFSNIDHNILIKLIQQQIKDERVLNICKQAINEFGEKGLGLGAQISQILAIYYPSQIDYYIKNIAKQKYYGRYMDDSYILSPDKEELKKLLISIKTIADKLNIKINTNKTRILKIKDGVPFLQCKYRYTKKGYILRTGGKSSAKRTRKKIKYFKKQMQNNKVDKDYVESWYKSWRGFIMEFDSKTVLKNTDLYYNKYIGGNIK